MELKDKIEKILRENEVNPKIIVDLGCKHMPYFSLFSNSRIIGFDIIQTMKLYKKLQQNDRISFFFKNFNFNQNIPEADLVIASLFLHFIKKEAREKLFEEIKKSKYFLVVHLDKKVQIPKEFKLIAKDEFYIEKDIHDGLPEHSHHLFIELYKIS